MLSDRDISATVGSTAYDADGDKLGTVEHFFVDDRTGVPTWVAVITGLFGTRTSIVPVQSASVTDGRLVLPVTKESVRSAPSVGEGGHLTPDDESALRQHYGLGIAGAPVATQDDAAPVPAAASDTGGEVDTGRHAAPEPAAGAPAGTASDRSDGGMVRSEERLQVGTERVAARRVRIVKYVVTEEVQITVPVRREEIRIEEVPLDAPDAGPGESLVATDPGSTGGGLPDEIVLHTERPVVTVEVVPTERVRLRTEVVQGQETVTGQVQREQIAVDHQPAHPSGTAPR